MTHEPENEPLERDNRHRSPLILFPEIIGVSRMAILMPFLLVKMLLAGQALEAGFGFLLWAGALIFMMCCLRRRHYYLAYLPMIVIFGLYFLLQKVLHP